MKFVVEFPDSSLLNQDAVGRYRLHFLRTAVLAINPEATVELWEGDFVDEEVEENELVKEALAAFAETRS